MSYKGEIPKPPNLINSVQDMNPECNQIIADSHSQSNTNSGTFGEYCNQQIQVDKIIKKL